MKKLSLTILTVLLLMALATWAFGFGWGRAGGGRGCGPGEGYGEGIAARLNLTADQEAQFRSLKEAHWQEMKPTREALFAKREELMRLWREQDPDPAKIAAMQKELRGLRDQMQDKATAHRLAFLKALTPEQKSKLQEYHGSRIVAMSFCEPRSWTRVLSS